MIISPTKARDTRLMSMLSGHQLQLSDGVSTAKSSAVIVNQANAISYALIIQPYDYVFSTPSPRLLANRETPAPVHLTETDKKEKETSVLNTASRKLDGPCDTLTNTTNNKRSNEERCFFVFFGTAILTQKFPWAVTYMTRAVQPLAQL